MKPGKDDRKWNIWVDGTFNYEFPPSIEKVNYLLEEGPSFLMSDEDERPLTLNHIPPDDKHFFLVDMSHIDPMELATPGDRISLIC